MWSCFRGVLWLPLEVCYISIMILLELYHCHCCVWGCLYCHIVLYSPVQYCVYILYSYWTSYLVCDHCLKPHTFFGSYCDNFNMHKDICAVFETSHTQHGDHIHSIIHPFKCDCAFNSQLISSGLIIELSSLWFDFCSVSALWFCPE